MDPIDGRCGSAPAGDADPEVARPCRRLGAGRVRPHPGAVRGECDRGCAALAQGLRPRLGQRGVRDAAAIDEHPLGPRVGEGPDRRPDPRDLPADRPLAAGRDRLQGPRREHHPARLRRTAGRRRHPDRRDHRRVRRARGRGVVPARPQAAEERAADRLGGRGLGRHHRRRPDARPLLRGGRPGRDRHEPGDHRRRQVHRGAGHGRGRAVRPRRAGQPAGARYGGLRGADQVAAGGAAREQSVFLPRTTRRSSRSCAGS